jgi:pimeloyl-ACP methyl ester carboxylesterase
VAVVALHPSLGRPARDFGPILDALTGAGHRVVLVDPVHGATMSELAQGVLDALDAHGVDPAGRVHLVGHAFGNRVMRCFATDHPHRVRSVTLFGSGGRVPGDAAATAALGRVLWHRGTDDDVRAALRICMFAPGNEPPDDWVDGWLPALAQAQHAASSATPVEHWWTAGAEVPVLVVQGLQDRLAPPANGRALVEALGDRARLVELDTMGHAMLPEQPAELAAVLLAFLAEVGA